jgi:hypothetical protein
MSSVTRCRPEIANRPRRSRYTVTVSAVGIAVLAMAMTSAAADKATPGVEPASISVSRAGDGAPIPSRLSLLAAQIDVPARDLADLAPQGALPDGWEERLKGAHVAGEAIGRDLGLDEASRALLAGHLVQHLIRIEREARAPRKASFDELVEGVRRDAQETLRRNLGEKVAAAARVVLDGLAPLKSHGSPD